MKNIEKIKFISGTTLLLFAILGGIIFFLESFKIFDKLLNYGNLSTVFEGGWVLGDNGWTGGGSSNIPIFLGLCGLAGAYLLASIRPTSAEKNTIQPNKEV